MKRVSLPYEVGRVTVRDARSEDDLDALHLGDPLWSSRDRVEQWVAGQPFGAMVLSLVADLDQEPVCHGLLSALPRDGGTMGSGLVYVRPEFRGDGARRAMFLVMAHQCHLSNLRGFLGWVESDDSQLRSCISQIGGYELEEHEECELNLTAMDRTALEEIVDRAARDGLRLAPLNESSTESEWRGAYDVCIDVLQMAPDAAGQFVSPSYEQWRAGIGELELLEFAWQGDTPLGVSRVQARPDGLSADTGPIGVLRRAWGRGILAALRASQSLRLADAGFERVVAHNLEIREPVLEADAVVGFVPVRTWVEYVVPAREGL